MPIIWIHPGYRETTVSLREVYKLSIIWIHPGYQETTISLQEVYKLPIILNPSRISRKYRFITGSIQNANNFGSIPDIEKQPFHYLGSIQIANNFGSIPDIEKQQEIIYLF